VPIVRSVWLYDGKAGRWLRTKVNADGTLIDFFSHTAELWTGLEGCGNKVNREFACEWDLYPELRVE
jgi:hypothetical protein